jgi:hypothetical protein
MTPLDKVFMLSTQVRVYARVRVRACGHTADSMDSPHREGRKREEEQEEQAGEDARAGAAVTLWLTSPRPPSLPLPVQDRLDERTLQAILMSGHSRVPVHRCARERGAAGRRRGEGRGRPAAPSRCAAQLPVRQPLHQTPCGLLSPEQTSDLRRGPRAAPTRAGRATARPFWASSWSRSWCWSAPPTTRPWRRCGCARCRACGPTRPCEGG